MVWYCDEGDRAATVVLHRLFVSAGNGKWKEWLVWRTAEGEQGDSSQLVGPGIDDTSGPPVERIMFPVAELH